MKRYLLILILLHMILVVHSKSLYAKEIPSFTLVDIELFSVTISEQYSMNSGIYVDYCTGDFVFHFGFLGAYAFTEFLAYDVAFGYIFSSEYLRNQPTSRLVDVQRLWDRTIYTYKGLRSDMVKLHIAEVGIKGFFTMWTEKPTQNGTLQFLTNSIIVLLKLITILMIKFYILDINI